MRRGYSLLMTAILAGSIAASAHATILPSGVDTNRQSGGTPHTRQQAIPCNVLWYGGDTGGEVARLTGLGLNITVTNNPADLNAGNLANYFILVVAYTGSGVIGGAQPDIENFVSGGGALLIHQPNAAGALDYTPTGFGVTITDLFWCGFPNTYSPVIVNNAHPITSGLANTDLSGAFDLVGAIGAGYTLLAANPACSDPALAAGELGSGRVVFEDGNPNPASLQSGSDLYWENVFNWLCVGTATPTHRTTWGEVKTTYR